MSSSPGAIGRRMIAPCPALTAMGGQGEEVEPGEARAGGARAFYSKADVCPLVIPLRGGPLEELVSCGLNIWKGRGV
jgi:hypothetical protein